jgi:hypothetical protein
MRSSIFLVAKMKVSFFMAKRKFLIYMYIYTHGRFSNEEAGGIQATFLRHFFMGGFTLR